MTFTGQSTMFPFFIFTVAIAILSLSERSLANNSNQADVSETLNYLRTKVDTLDGKLDAVEDQLDTVNHKLDVLVGADGNDVEASGTESGAGETTTTHARPAHLLSVERYAISADENRFTVRLRNTTEEKLNFVIYAYGQEKALDDITEEAGNVLAASVICNTSPHTENVFFQIMDSRYSRSLTLMLRNTPSNSTTQDLHNISIPLMQVSPELEAVYDPGHDVNVTVTLIPSQPTTDSPNIRASLRGVDLSSGEYNTVFRDPGLIQEYVHPRSPGDLEVSVTFLVSTASHPVSGYFSVTLHDLITTFTPVVMSFEMGISIPVRPSNQTGPFPAGYLKVIDYFWREKSKNGNELSFCSVGEECPMDCYAVGENVTDITVMEVQQDGGMGEVSSATVAPRRLDTVRSIGWMFQARADSGNDDGITTFMCSAYSGATGQVAVKLVDVLTKIPGKFVENGSSVLVEVDPNDPSQRKVTLNCAVSGRPLPMVTFYGWSVQDELFGDSADTVIHTGPNEAVAQRVLTESAEQLEALGPRLSTAYSCTFYDNLFGNGTSHTFDLSEIDF